MVSSLGFWLDLLLPKCSLEGSMLCIRLVLKSLSLSCSLSLSHTHTHTQFISHSPSLKYIIDISTFPSPQRKRSNHQQRGSRRHVLSSGYHVSPNHTAAPNLILFLTHRRAAHRTFHNCKHFQNKNTSNSEFQVETLAAF